MTELSTAKDIQVGGADVQVPFEHQYDIKEMSEVSYYTYKRFQSTATPTPALNGTCLSEWEISPQLVYNLSKSFLEVDILIARPAVANVNCLHAGFCSLIDTLEFVDASGQRIAQIMQVPYYTKLIYRPTTEMSDFLGYSVTQILPDLTAPVLNGSRTGLFHRSNVSGPAVAAINAQAPALLAISSTGTIVPAVAGRDLEAYTGVASLAAAATSADPAAGAIGVRVSIPLRYFAGTIFAVNKDFFYGQTMRIRCTWNNSAKWGFSAVAADGTFPTALTTAASFVANSDIIRVAVQANPLSVEAVRRRVAAGPGIHMPIPFVTS